jgi:hypothetical protein
LYSWYAYDEERMRPAPVRMRGIEKDACDVGKKPASANATYATPETSFVLYA